MQKRSRLDEIEDLNYTEKCLIGKRLSEEETKNLLLKRGLSPQESDEKINLIKDKFKGVRFFEASKISRRISFSIDLIILISINIIILFWASPYFKLDTREEFLVLIFVLLMYFIPMGYYLGASVGKLITGNKIVNVNFDKPSLFQIFTRTFSSTIRGPWWYEKYFNDIISNTHVVNKKLLAKKIDTHN